MFYFIEDRIKYFSHLYLNNYIALPQINKIKFKLNSLILVFEFVKY